MNCVRRKRESTTSSKCHYYSFRVKESLFHILEQSQIQLQHPF